MTKKFQKVIQKQNELWTPDKAIKIPESIHAIPNSESRAAFLLEATTNLKLLRFQRDFFHQIENRQLQGIVASRQVGKTQGLAGFAYSFALLYPGTRTQIVSTGDTHAQEILLRVRSYFMNSKLRSILKFEIDNKSELKLEHNSSSIVSSPSNPNTLAGYSNHLVIIDEVAKIDQWNEMRAALFPTISQTGGKIVVSSSFKGKNHFWEMVCDPIWNFRFYPWWVHPSPMIDLARRMLPPAQFEEEYNCNPVDEKHSLFPYELIEALTFDNIKEFFW